MTLQQSVQTVLLSAAVCAIAIGSYDKWIRQPRTPRLAVVDVGALFASAQQASSVAVIKAPGAKASDAPNTDFGPRLQTALEATARQCACTLVAMPAVFGVSAGVPDLTPTVRQRLAMAGADPDPSARWRNGPFSSPSQ